MVNKYQCTALIRSMLTPILSLANIGAFLFGLNGGLLGAGLPIAPIAFRNSNVFLAAPSRSIIRTSRNVQRAQLNAPPEYLRVTADIEQPSQLIPSSGSTSQTPGYVIPETDSSGGSGITFGTSYLGFTMGPGPGLTFGVGGLLVAWLAKTGCTTVDVWETQKDANAPSTNDPSAKVILRINPPSGNGSSCTVWRWHNREIPVEKSPRIIHPHPRRRRDNLSWWWSAPNWPASDHAASKSSVIDQT
jgi:hypothetical protein